MLVGMRTCVSVTVCASAVRICAGHNMYEIPASAAALRLFVEAVELALPATHTHTHTQTNTDVHTLAY